MAIRVPIHTHMIISEQQVRLVLEYLHTKKQPMAARDLPEGEGVTDDLVERIKREIAGAPETSDERVAMGREFVASHSVTSAEVAEKMIGRMISDSLR
jgi:hypothetical protein